ncbi:MAG: response regulator FixJ [Pseudomonadota bacterium]
MTGALIHIVDDDESVRDALGFLLLSADYAVRRYSSARQFLDSDPQIAGACLLTDIRMPDMDGLELQTQVVAQMKGLPVIVMTGHGDVPLAVKAMRAGAIDFLEKPFEDELLLDCIKRALEVGAVSAEQGNRTRAARLAIESLTPRERAVLDLLVEGHPNKIIADRLGISPRTVEVHREHVMDKMQARTVADLVRKALAADGGPR